MPLKYFLAPAFFILCILVGADVSAQDTNIYLKTSPVPERLRPFSDPATLSLLVTGADGKPVASGWLNLRLEAPRPIFFSTDFPLAEGSILTEMRLPLRAGKAEWRYNFPIRGEYRLFVEVLAPDGSQSSKMFAIEVREHRSKWLTLAAFMLGLLGVGVLAGRIFTRPVNKGAGALAAIFSASLFFTLSSPTAFAQAGAVKPIARLEIDSPAAGKLARIRWVLDANGGNAGRRALLSLAITHIEKKMTVFAVDKIPVEGEFSINFHFVDGAEHRVSARAELPGGKAMRSEQVVSVSAVEPPASAMLPALGLFLTMITLGLAVGRWSRCHATPS
ncbi:MAG TPA: hypothetical protein VJQ48_12520 [Candidatus Binatia bacterium]|nr:hypothetical protein [Candidatus Binatia bacterium]